MRTTLLRLVLGAVVGATLVEPGTASAYCRKTTKSAPDSSYDPQTTGSCGATSDALPLYWPTTCVEYRVIVEPELLEKSAFSLEDARALVGDAVKAWVEAPCAHARASVRSPTVRLVDVDVARCDGGPVGAAAATTNEIRFRADAPTDPGNIAVTTNSFDPESGVIREAQIAIFRTALLDGYRANPSANAAFAAVVRHEVGHLLGLAHSEQSTAIMYAYYNNAPPPGLTVDDIDAVCDAYDPDFPVAAGCNEGPLARHEPPALWVALLVPLVVVIRRAPRGRRRRS